MENRMNDNYFKRKKKVDKSHERKNTELCMMCEIKKSSVSLKIVFEMKNSFNSLPSSQSLNNSGVNI